MEQRPTPSNRRDDTAVAVTPVDATVTFTVGTNEVELDAAIVGATARTVVVELGSGASTLALAMAPTCQLVLRARDLTIAAEARPGRRSSDVPHPTRVELVVLDEQVDPRRLAR